MKPDALYTTELGTTVRAYHYVSRKTNQLATRLVWPDGTGYVVRKCDVNDAVESGELTPSN